MVENTHTHTHIPTQLRAHSLTHTHTGNVEVQRIMNLPNANDIEYLISAMRMGGVICNEFFFAVPPLRAHIGRAVIVCCALVRFAAALVPVISIVLCAMCMYARVSVCATALHPEGEKYEIVNSR